MLFFTCATKFYENFIIPYVYFAEMHNPGSLYEFIVDDPHAFQDKNHAALQWLESKGIKPVFRAVSEVGMKPKMQNTYRFMLEPKQRAEFVYIGDIDILILDNLMDHHRPVFDAGFPYSNMVRPNTTRLTGLHFTRYEALYPLPEFADLVAKHPNDEDVLYHIVERKGFLYEADKWHAIMPGRSVHGVHMSMNRLPFFDKREAPPWGLNWPMLERCDQIFQAEDFRELFFCMYNGPKQILANLMVICEGAKAMGRERFEQVVRTR